MSDSYVKDIVYDLIQSKLRIKELEDKVVALESENVKLTNVNNELKKEVNKWKSHVVSYIDDYRNIYLNSTETIEKSDEIDETNEVIDVIEQKEEENKVNVVETNKKIDNVTPNDETRKARNEYMKEYMKNKRKQQKEEMKKVVIVKK